MSTHEAVTPAGTAELRLIATVCGGGSCPTVYRTDRGTYVVQGRTVTSGGAGVDLPDGESLVEIPAELLDRLRDEG